MHYNKYFYFLFLYVIGYSGVVGSGRFWGDMKKIKKIEDRA